MNKFFSVFSAFFCAATLLNNLGTQENIFIHPLTINTIYGNFKVTEPVLIELFNSPAMKRIKHIRQYGLRLRYKTKKRVHTV